MLDKCIAHFAQGWLLSPEKYVDTGALRKHTSILVYSCRKSWLVYTHTRDKNRMEALWCLCLQHNRGSEWFSPPERLREAQPAGCCLLGVFDGKGCEQTRRLCSFSSVNLLCLFTNLSLIYIKEDQMLLKADQTHLNGKKQIIYLQRKRREKQGDEVMKQDGNWKEGQWRLFCFLYIFIWHPNKENKGAGKWKHTFSSLRASF